MGHASRPPVMSLVVWSALIPILPFFAASLLLDGATQIVESLIAIDLTTILSLVYLAFVATIVGYGIWGRCSGVMKLACCAALLLVPVVGLASAALLLDETLSALQLFGAVLIMAGLYINVFGFRWRRTAQVRIVGRKKQIAQGLPDVAALIRPGR